VQRTSASFYNAKAEARERYGTTRETGTLLIGKHRASKGVSRYTNRDIIVGLTLGLLSEGRLPAGFNVHLTRGVLKCAQHF
jgi:hypothetical protein